MERIKETKLNEIVRTRITGVAGNIGGEEQDIFLQKIPWDI